jgi:hypothetical protein
MGFQLTNKESEQLLLIQYELATDRFKQFDEVQIDAQLISGLIARTGNGVRITALGYQALVWLREGLRN